MVLTVPQYKTSLLQGAVKVEILVISAGRNSEPVEFYYAPAGILQSTCCYSSLVVGLVHQLVLPFCHGNFRPKVISKSSHITVVTCLHLCYNEKNPS